MRELMIYKDICIKSEAFGGRAVGVSDMIGYYSFSKSTYYRALKKLIQHGFVTRIDRGMYLPVAWPSTNGRCPTRTGIKYAYNKTR